MSGPLFAQILFWVLIVGLMLVMVAALCVIEPMFGVIIVTGMVFYLIAYIINLLYQWAYFGDVYFTEFWTQEVHPR